MIIYTHNIDATKYSIDIVLGENPLIFVVDRASNDSRRSPDVSTLEAHRGIGPL